MSDVCEVQQHHNRRREVGSIQSKCHGLEKILMQQLELGRPHTVDSISKSENPGGWRGTRGKELCLRGPAAYYQSNATSKSIPIRRLELEQTFCDSEKHIRSWVVGSPWWEGLVQY